MPGRTLPTITSTDVASRKTAASCYVTVGTKVYDVTGFLDAHPGGGELILEYGGKDVAEIMDDQLSHAHSDSAKEMLDEMLIGFVATAPVMKTAVQSEKPENILPLPPNNEGMRELRENGVTGEPPRDQVCAATGMSSAADLSKETDANADYHAHKFLDLDKPLLMQVWHGGFSKDFYLEQVHRPRHYKGGKSAPLFGNFLEPLSKTPWYVIPIVWLPPVAYGSFLAYQGLQSFLQTLLYWLTGLGLWTLIEYGMHRGLFHVDKYLPDNRVGLTAHFLLHGIHHYLPMDKLRLVMPPTLFVALATPFYKLAHTIFYWDWYAATAVFCGGIFGYICYDLTHYFLHHKTLPSFYQDLKKYHLQHHYKDFENGFGVTSRFWDRVFGTELAPLRQKVD
ncbi:fatty acid alpha-hydroxylase [Lobaria immixta]|nr:fatty acid alpha-hydroxylase [Lobaria immixta]